MDYISSKDLAKKWQIDPSRIVRLAKAGRIPGAMQIGNSWMYPADSERLPDMRRKENQGVPCAQTFRFPLYFYIQCREDARRSFTEDESFLYEAESVYLKGEYSACCEMLEERAEKFADPTVQIGALYILCMSSLYLRHFMQASGYFRKIQSLLQDDVPHREVLVLMLHDLESYFTGNRFYLDDFSLCFKEEYMPQMRDYYMLQMAFSDVMQAYFKGTPVNFLHYELFFHAEEKSLTPYTATLLHLYVALLYQSNGHTDRALEHLKASCALAEELRIEHAIAFSFHYIPEVFRMALEEENPSQLERLKQHSVEETERLNDLHEFLKKENILHFLDEKDMKFISYAHQDLTNKEIGAILGLSTNTISKKYSVLLEKTGLHSKKELVRRYIKAMQDYGNR